MAVVSARVALLLILLLALAPAVHAAVWTRVEAERFIVYGDQGEGVVRGFALKLSAYDQVLRRLYARSLKAGPPLQKLDVYLIDGPADLQRVRPGISPATSGLFSSSPDATFAIVRTDAGADAEQVLFHEYAHRFMLANFPAAYPAWYVEGWAEYFMTMEFGAGYVDIGKASANRAAWLAGAPWLPYDKVLSGRPADFPVAQRSLYYGQAWLLTHYMRATPASAARLDRAMATIANGGDPVVAIERAAGADIPALTRQLKAYARPAWRLDNPVGKPPATRVSALPPSAEVFLFDSLRLNNLTPQQPDPAYVADLRARAAAWPDDALAQITLARAEMILGDADAGAALFDRWLMGHPDDVQALLTAAILHLSAGDRDPARHAEYFRRAGDYAQRAYGLEPSDYRILYARAYARSINPGFPRDEDLALLRSANRLGPSVDEVAVLLGEALLKRGDRTAGLRLLGRVANSPHGGPKADAARAIIDAAR